MKNNLVFPQTVMLNLRIGREGIKEVEGLRGGLTKRELFAAMAMQGILANQHVHGPVYQDNEESIAEKARRVADVLLKELEQASHE